MFDDTRTTATAGATKRVGRARMSSRDLGSAMLVVMGAAAVLFVIAASVVGVIVFQQTQQVRAQAVGRATVLAQQGMEAYLSALRTDPDYWVTTPTIAGMGEEGTWTVVANIPSSTITAVGHDRASGQLHVIKGEVRPESYSDYTIVTGGTVALGRNSSGITITGAVRSNSGVDLQQDFPGVVVYSANPTAVVNPGNAESIEKISPLDFSQIKNVFPNLYTASWQRTPWATGASMPQEAADLVKPMTFYRDPNPSRSYWGVPTQSDPAINATDLVGVGVDFSNVTPAEKALGIFYIRSMWTPNNIYANVSPAEKASIGRQEFIDFARQDPTWNINGWASPDLAGRPKSITARALDPNGSNVIYVGGSGDTALDVYVTGEVSKSVTIVSERDIYIIGSITRAPNTTATVGLVAKGNIYVCGAMPQATDPNTAYETRTGQASVLTSETYTRGAKSGPSAANGKAAGVTMPNNVTIEASMLAVEGAIIMDPENPVVVSSENPTGLSADFIEQVGVPKRNQLNITGALIAREGIRGSNFVNAATTYGGFDKTVIGPETQAGTMPPPLFPQTGSGAIRVTRWDEYSTNVDPNDPSLTGLALPDPNGYGTGGTNDGADIFVKVVPVGGDNIKPVTHSNVMPSYTSTAVITLTAVDTANETRGAIWHTWFQIDGGAITTYTTEATLTQDPDTIATRTITYWSKDKADNLEDPVTITFVMRGRDTLPPFTTVKDTDNPGMDLPSGYPQITDPPYVVFGDFAPQFTAVDAGPAGLGVNQIWSMLQKGDVQLKPEIYLESPTRPNEAIVAAPGIGSVSLKYKYFSYDKAGNREATKTLTVVQRALDVVGPFITHDVAPLGLYVGDAKLNLRADDGDDGQGVASISYHVDNGPWITVKNAAITPSMLASIIVTAPPAGSAPASHTVYFFATDAATDRFHQPSPNTGQYYELPILVGAALGSDTTKPQTITDAQSPYIGPATINLYSTDPAGIADIYWSLDGAQVTTGSTVHIPAPLTGSLGHTLQYWAVDKANPSNREDTQSVTFVVMPEDVKPITTANNFKLYTVPTIKFQLTAKDNEGGSGLKETRYRIDSQAEISSPEPLLGLTWVTVSGEGSHTVEYWSVDKANNAEVHKFATFMIDTVAPVSSSSASSTITYSGQATITLSAFDAGSGVSYTHWRNKANGIEQITNPVMVGPPASGTTVTIEYWSVDKAGNDEHIAPNSIKSFTVKVVPGPDNNAPKSYDTHKPYYNSSDPNPAVISLFSWDVQSGIRYMYVQKDSESTATTYAGVGIPPADYKVNATGDGTHTVTYWAQDASGNVEATRNVATFYIDRVDPQTTCDAAAGGRYWKPMTFALRGTDSGSGIDSTYYSLDGGPEIPGTQIYVPTPANGVYETHTIWYWSVDRAGNAEQKKSVTFSSWPLDIVPPTTYSDVRSTYSRLGIVSLWAHDNAGGSGVASTYYRIDNSAECTGNVFRVDMPGTHKLEYWSVDRAGNVESPHTFFDFTVTGYGPQTSWDIVPWYTTKPAALHLTARDEAGGTSLQGTFYRIDGGAIATGTPPVTTISVASEGTHTIDFWSRDSLGQTEDTRTVPFGIDTIKPTTRSDAGGSYVGRATFTLLPDDGARGSGIANTFWRKSGDTTQTGVTVSVDGPQNSSTTSYTVYVWSVDIAGNIENAKRINFTIGPMAEMNFFNMIPSVDSTITSRNATIGVSAHSSVSRIETSPVIGMIDGVEASVTCVVNTTTTGGGNGGTQSFSAAGGPVQTFTVPSGVTTLAVTINGSGGGGGGSNMWWEDDNDASSGNDGGASSVVYGGGSYVAYGGGGGGGADCWGDDGGWGGSGTSNLNSPIYLYNGSGYGSVLFAGPTWATARTAAAGNAIYPNQAFTVSNLFSPTFRVGRTFLPFALPGVPGIASASLSFGALVPDWLSGDAALFQGTQSNPLTVSSFSSFTGPEIAPRAVNPRAGGTFALNSTGISYLNSATSAGTAKFCIRTSKDVDNTTPTTHGTNESMASWSFYAQLRLTYTGWATVDGAGALGGAGGTNADNDGGTGGAGAKLVGTLNVTPGQVVTVNVGTGGAGGDTGNNGDTGSSGSNGSVILSYGAGGTTPVTTDSTATASFQATGLSRGYHFASFTFTDATGKKATKTWRFFNDIPANYDGPNTTSDILAWYKSTPATIHLTAHDNAGGSNLKNLFYQLDGGAVITGTTPVSTMTVSTEGTHTLSFWATDKYGFVETTQVASFGIDLHAPNTASNALSNYESSANFTLTPSSESNGSGIAGTYWKVSGEPTRTGTAVSVPGPGDDSTVERTVYFWSEDLAGNVEAPKSVTFKILPPGMMLFSGMSPSEASTITISNWSVGVTATTEAAAINGATGKLDGVSMPVSFSAVTTTTNGSATWGSGEVSVVGSRTVVVFRSSDTINVSKAITGAEVLIVAGGGGGQGNLSGGGGGGGVVTGARSLAPGSLSITVGAGGAAGLYPSAIASAGANSSIGTMTAIGGGGAASRDFGGAARSGGSGGGGAGGGWSVGGSGTALQGFGGGNGYDNSIYSGGGGGGGAGGAGGNGSSYQGGIGGIGKLSSITGAYKYYAGGGGGGSYMYSGAGGEGGGGNGQYGTGTANGVKDGTAGKVNTGGGGGAAGAGSGGSGIVIISYPTPTTITSATASFSASRLGNGEHTASFTFTNSAGQKSTKTWKFFVDMPLDFIPPVTTAYIDGVALVPEGPGFVGPTMRSNATTVALVAIDDGSGVANTTYKIDGGAEANGTPPFSTLLLSAEGKHTLEFWSTDSTSNVEAHKIVDVWIDKTPPTTTATNLATYKNQASFSLIATDSISGVKTTYYQIQAAPTPYSATGSYTATKSPDGLRTILTFTGSGSLTVSNPVANASVLVVAGGGAGINWCGGGGGGGGVASGTVTLSGTMPITVGAGGPAGYYWESPLTITRPSKGANSVFGSSSTTITAIGGGYGACRNLSDLASAGGSGGGGAGQYQGNAAGASGTAGQGNSGGNGTGNLEGHSAGAGGGGAGAPGGNGVYGVAGAGGIGIASSISGSSVLYGGGGGGMSWDAAVGAAGGQGGGGKGDPGGSAGLPNTGGGGGASAIASGGGSGVVIVSFPTSVGTTVSTGDVVTVPGPIGGAPVPYTVNYWSDDRAGNVENAKTATFTVSFYETNPPATTADVQSIYNATSTISLTATDIQSGVAFSQYRLTKDGTILMTTRTNYAAASSGATASASSVFNSNYPASAVIDGDRKGLNWGTATGGWASVVGATTSTVQTLTVSLAGTRTIDEADVFAIQDNYASPLQPTASMTYATLGPKNYKVQYWTGTAWADVSGASVTNNNLVWRQFNFSPITTSKIQVVITLTPADKCARLVQVEAWGTQTAADGIMTGGEFSTGGQGTYGLEYLSVDNNGNREDTHTVSYRVDQTAPVTTCDVSTNTTIVVEPTSVTTTITTGSDGSQNFSTDGTFRVPDGVTALTVDVRGAGGAGGNADSYGPGTPASPGAYGDTVKNVLAVTPGQTLTVVVGRGGNRASYSVTTGGSGGSGYTNGSQGGNGYDANNNYDDWAYGGGGGGGSSGIKLGTTKLAEARGGSGGRGSDYDGDSEFCTGGQGGLGGGSNYPSITASGGGGAGSGTGSGVGGDGWVTITWGTATFGFTGGDQTVVVPAGVTAMNVDLYGAAGAGDNDTYGGSGGGVHATVPVTPNQVLTVRVGGTGTEGGSGPGGWPNGGSSGDGGDGGGSTSILSGTSVWLEAGGGGGGECGGVDGGSGGWQGSGAGGNQRGVDWGAGGGGGWNGGAGADVHDGSGQGGSSYIAVGTGSLEEGVNGGYGSAKITWAGSAVTSTTVVPGSAVLHLIPTDNHPGSSGVEATYWTLDDTSQTAGTTITVPGTLTGSAVHHIDYWSRDRAQNTETPTKTTTFTVMAKPADITFGNRTPASLTTTLTRSPVVSVNGTSTTNNIISASGTLDGAQMSTSLNPASNSKTGKAQFSTAGLQDGTHTVSFTFIDTGGFQNTDTWSFTVLGPDIKPPTTTSDASSSYEGTVTIHLTAVDPVSGAGWGVKATRYAIDSLTTFATSTLNPTTISIPAPLFGPAVSHYIQFYSVDNNGNVETSTKSATFTVAPNTDSTAPTTSCDATASYVGPATIHLSVVDNPGGQGVAPGSTFYILDHGSVVAGTSIFVTPPPTGSTTHTLEFYSIDRATNRELTKSVDFRVDASNDSIPPTTTPTYQRYYQSESTITLSVADNLYGSGPDYTMYRKTRNGIAGLLTTGTPTPTTTLVPTGDQAHYLLNFWSRDHVGNPETPKTIEYWVDWTAPITSCDATPTHMGPAVVTLSAIETDTVGGSGVLWTKYNLDNAGWTTGTVVNISDPTTGTVLHTLQYLSQDRAGNLEQAHTSTITIQSIPADITYSAWTPARDSTVTVSRSFPVSVRGIASGTNITNVTAKLDGVARSTYWSYNGGLLNDVSAHFDVTNLPDGVYTAEFTYTVTSGRQSIESWTFKIGDCFAPTTDNNHSDYYRAESTITLNPYDEVNGSGVDYTKFQKVRNGIAGAISTGTSAPTGDQGHYFLNFWSADKHGNKEGTKTVEYWVDWTPPVSSSNASSTYDGAASITLSAIETDTLYGSGVARIEYKLDTGNWLFGGSTTVVNVPDPAVGSASHTLLYRAVDYAGNVETPTKSATFTINAVDADVRFSEKAPSPTAAVRNPMVTVRGKASSNITRVTAKLDDTTVTVGGWYNTNQTDYTAYFYPANLQDGTHTVSFTYTVANGNQATTSWSFIESGPDNISPETTSDVQPSYVGTATIHFYPTDPHVGNWTGIKGTFYSLNGSTQPSATVFSVTPPVYGTSSPYTMYYWSVDNAGNEEVHHPYTFTVTAATDTVAPTTTCTVLPVYTGSTGTGISLTASDNAGGWGLDHTEYRLDSNPTVLSLTRYRSINVLPSIQGPTYGFESHTLYFRSVDRVTPTSNTEAWKSVDFTIKAATDTVAPVTGISGNLSVYGTPSNIALNPTDVGQGVAYTHWLRSSYSDAARTVLLGTAQEGSGTSVPTGSEGYYKLAYGSVDRAGNSETTKTWTYVVDETAPTTSDNSASTTTFTVNASVQLHATDSRVGASGVRNTYYKIDGKVPQQTRANISNLEPWNCTVVIPRTLVSGPPEQHTLTYWSDDVAGHPEASKTVTVTIQANADNTPPTTVVTDRQPFYGGPALMHLSASDSGWGIQSTNWRVDNGTTQTASTLVAINGNGPHTIYYWSVDWANNIESANSVTCTIDTTPPVTSSDASSTYNGPATIHLTPDAGVNGSPIASTWWYLDNAGPYQGTTISVAASLTANVVHHIDFYSKDAMGNSELAQMKVATFTVNAVADTTAPELSSTGVSSYSKPATITITAVDRGWGMRNIKWRLGATGIVNTPVTTTTPGVTTQTCQVRLDQGGSQVLTYWASDQNGNVTTNTLNFTVAPDTTPPETTSNVVASRAYTGLAQISLTATDTGWGVQYTKWSDNGAETTGTYITLPDTLTGSVQHVVKYWSVDWANNPETPHTETITVNAIPAPMRFKIIAPLEGSSLGTITTPVSISATSSSQAFTAATISVWKGTTKLATSAVTLAKGTIAGGYAATATATYTGLANGQYTVTAAFTGTDGRQDSKTWSFTCAPQTDYTPPFTTSNMQSSYWGTATISLVASDPIHETGHEAVSTFYNLDAKGWVAGTQIVVSAPTTGAPIQHTLVYYSVDSASPLPNKEVTSTPKYFTVGLNDVTPPVTSSNAAQYYKTLTASIILYPLDVNGSGVAHTYYKLDEGQWTEGKALGAGAAGQHHLQYYSVDSANNTETPPGEAYYTVDIAKPQTSNDAKTDNPGLTTIHLSVQDPAPSSGIRSTFYSLDDAEPVPGDVIVVQPPTFGFVVHHIDVWSIDNAGNSEDTKTTSFNVLPNPDITPPVTSIIAARKAYDVPSLITLSADDLGGWGVRETWWSLDLSEPTQGLVVRTGAPTASGEVHTLTYWSADKADNWESPHRVTTYTVTAADSTPPFTSTDATATYPGAATIKLTATDTQTASAQCVTYYKLDEGAWTPGTVVNVLSPPSGTATHTLYYYSVDMNGVSEQSMHRSVTFSCSVLDGGMTFDGINPADKSEIVVHDPVITVSAHGSYNVTTATLTLDGSTVPAKVTVLGTSATLTYAASYLKSDPTYGVVHRMSASFTDVRGGTSTTSTIFTVKAPKDEKQPVTTTDLKSFYRDIAVITLTAHDETSGSGVAVTRYRLDSDPEVVGTPPVTTLTVSDPGPHSITWWSVDADNNVEDPITRGFNVDLTKPHTDSDVPESHAYDGDAVINLTPDDFRRGSGIAGTHYIVDVAGEQSGTVITVPAPTVPGTSQWHTAYFWSVDQAGNVEDTETVTFNVWATEGAAPAFTIASMLGAEGSAPVEAVATDTVAPVTSSDALTAYLGTGEIHLTGTDNAGGSGVVHTYYQWDDGPKTESTMIGVSGVGTHHVDFWSVDAAGNVEAPKNAIFEVTAPDITAPVTKTDALASYAGTATVTLTAADISGVRATFYRVDSGPAQPGTKVEIAPPASGSAPHDIVFWSVDNEGNTEVEQTVAFTVLPAPDTLAPVTSSDATSTYFGPAGISLTATDGVGSGVNHTYYRIDDQVMQEGTWVEVAAPASGTASHHIDFWSTDAAGNIEDAEKSRVDFTVSPSLTGTAYLSFIWSGTGNAALHVEDLAGTVINRRNLSGSGSSVTWKVPVPAGQGYRMVCDYLWNSVTSTSGSGSTTTTVLTPDQVFSWDF